MGLSDVDTLFALTAGGQLVWAAILGLYAHRKATADFRRVADEFAVTFNQLAAEVARRRPPMARKPSPTA